MKTPIFVAVLALCAGNPGAVMALGVPAGSNADYRIKHIEYNRDDLVRLDAVIGVATHIIVGPDEEYVTHAFGDAAGWEMFHVANHYFIKAKAQHSDTNLVIVTTKHSYNFALHFVGDIALKDPTAGVVHHEINTPWSLRDATLQLEFTYPAEAAAARSAAALARRQVDEKAQVQARLNTSAGPYNTHYSMSATATDRDIAPVNVWDDGRFTYFRFTPNTELPDIYIAGADGAESLVNRHNHDDAGVPVIVAEKVAKTFILRLGNAVVGVYNDQFDPAGVPNLTKTSSPDVRRVIKGEDVGAAPTQKSIRHVDAEPQIKVTRNTAADLSHSTTNYAAVAPAPSAVRPATALGGSVAAEQNAVKAEAVNRPADFQAPNLADAKPHADVRPAAPPELAEPAYKEAAVSEFKGAPTTAMPAEVSPPPEASAALIVPKTETVIAAAPVQPPRLVAVNPQSQPKPDGASSRYNANYTMSVANVDSAIAPANVWDDGRFTYFRFTGNVELPNVFVVDADKVEARARIRVNDIDGAPVIVAETVAKNFRLRLKNAVVGIYNDGFDSTGVSNQAPAVSPGAPRITMGAQ